MSEKLIQHTDPEESDNPVLRDIAAVFKKHGFDAFVYSAAKSVDGDKWSVDSAACIDDDTIPKTEHVDCIDTMMTDLTEMAHTAVHEIEDELKPSKSPLH